MPQEHNVRVPIVTYGEGCHLSCNYLGIGYGTGKIYCHLFKEKKSGHTVLEKEGRDIHRCESCLRAEEAEQC